MLNKTQTKNDLAESEAIIYTGILYNLNGNLKNQIGYC